jgi:uncharacterized coiled-coil protein SlyX
MDEHDIENEAIPRRRKSDNGVLVKIGNHRLTVPVATIVLGTLTALGTAYRVVEADRADILARISVQERLTSELSNKLEMEQIVLAEIRTQLARIDARVAEVQVTLMRGRQP